MTGLTVYEADPGAEGSRSSRGGSDASIFSATMSGVERGQRVGQADVVEDSPYGEAAAYSAVPADEKPLPKVGEDEPPIVDVDPEWHR